MNNFAVLSSKYSVINSLLIALYLYQYGLLIPLLVRFNSQAPITAFTALLIITYFFTNRFPTNLKTYLTIGIPLILILVKIAFTPVLIGEDNSNEILLNFLTIGISGILIGSVSFDFEKFLYYGTIIGWLNFIILFLIPLQNIDAVNYMRFGYAMLPTFCFSLYSFVREKNKVINGMIVLISGIEIAIFGARGSLLGVCLFMIIVLFSLSKKNPTLRIASLLGIVSLYLFNDVILLGIDKVLTSFGYSSYSFTKLLTLFNDSGDIESISSGRFDIYRAALKNISEYPLFGSPLNSAIVDTGFSYYHNLILDILVSFGVVIFIWFIVFIANSFIKMLKSDNISLRWIYCILFVLSFGRLMVSSTFWQRPEFWLFISFYTTNSDCFTKNIHKNIN